MNQNLYYSVHMFHIFTVSPKKPPDRVWTLREVRLFRVPPWPQPQAL